MSLRTYLQRAYHAAQLSSLAKKNDPVLEESVKALAKQRADYLCQHPRKLEKFILSGKKAVVHVVEQLPAEMVAKAMSESSATVLQRSVIDLMETDESRAARDKLKNQPHRKIKAQEGEVIRVFRMKYDRGKIWTKYFPGNIQRVLCFERKPTRVTGINRGLVISDRFSSNTAYVLDAMARMERSPLDHVLIQLREVQGLMYPTLTSTFFEVPRMGIEEFERRDHFTDAVRDIINGAVKEEFDNMEKNEGNPLSFRAYIKRHSKQGENFYVIDITWEA